MKYEMFTKQKMFFYLVHWWAAGMLRIVCIQEPYLTYGTWHNWVTQNCTQGFAGPCTGNPQSRLWHQFLREWTSVQHHKNKRLEWMLPIERDRQLHSSCVSQYAVLWAAVRVSVNLDWERQTANAEGPQCRQLGLWPSERPVIKRHTGTETNASGWLIWRATCLLVYHDL